MLRHVNVMAPATSFATTTGQRRSLYEAWRTALLLCGIASSVLYALMVWTIRYEGYDPISQSRVS